MTQTTQNPYQMPQANLSQASLLATADSDSSKPWSPSGRFGRLSFLAWNFVLMLAFFVVALVVMVPLGVFASGGADGGGMAALGILGALLVFAVSIAYLVVSVIFMVRRLHDLNKSGHWLWLLLVLYAIQMVGTFSQIGRIAASGAQPDPMAMMAIYASPLVWLPMLAVFAFFIYMTCFPGTKGENRFGPARVTPTWETVVGWIYIVLMILYIFVAIGSVISIISALGGAAS